MKMVGRRHTGKKRDRIDDAVSLSFIYGQRIVRQRKSEGTKSIGQKSRPHFFKVTVRYFASLSLTLQSRDEMQGIKESPVYIHELRRVEEEEGDLAVAPPNQSTGTERKYQE